MNTPRKTTSAPVPEGVSRTLRRLVTRLRRVILVRGMLGVLAVLVLSLLAVMALDACLSPVSAWPRWIATMTALVLTLACACGLLLRPLARSFTLTGVARMLEVRHPELQERLSSALELLMSDDAPEVRGSDALIAELARQADADARAVRPRREFTYRRARLVFAASLGGALVMAVLIIAWPHQSLRLLARAVAPFANLPNVHADELRLDPAEDTVVMEGERLRVTVDAPPSARFAELRAVSPEGDETIHAMEPVEAGGASGVRSFGAFCEPAREDFRYRVRAGDALTRYFHVTVVPRPAIESIYLTYHYPAYTGLSPRTEAEAPGHISGLVGTRVAVKVFTTSPVTAGDVLLGDRPVEATVREIAATGGSCCEFELPLTEDTGTTWSIRLRRLLADKQFTSEPAVFRVDVRHDSRPSVRAAVGSSHAEVFRLNRKDRPELLWRATDDFGVESAELRVEVDGEPLDAIPLEMQASAEQLGFVGRTRLDLPALGAATAASLRLQVAALDNRPDELGGPQVGLSRPLVIHFDDDVPYLHVQVRLDDEVLIRETLEAVLRDLKEAKQDSHDLRKSQAMRGPLTGQDVERVDRIRDKLAVVQGSVAGLIEEISTSVYASLTDRLGEVVSHGVRARSLAGEIKLADEADNRAALADETDFEIGRAVSLVARLLEQFNVLTDVVLRAAELSEISDEQQALAEMARELAAESPPEGITPEQWQEAQDALAKRTAELIGRMPSAMEAMTRRDAERSKSLTVRAVELSREQERLRKQSQELSEIERELAELTEQQRKLAGDTHKTQPIESLAQPMEAAAAQLEQAALGGAIEWQKTAEEGLEKRSAELRRESAAADAALRAAQIADRQRSLAVRTSRAVDESKQAEAAAGAAGRKASQSAAKARAELEGLSPVLARLADRQEALAERSGKLERSIAVTSEAAAATGVKPSKAMRETAKAIRQAALARAGQSAQESTAQAGSLEETLDEIAASPPDSKHLDRAVDAAQRDVKEARAAAAEARQAAAEADHRARRIAEGGESDEARKAREHADRLLKLSEDADRKAREAEGVLTTFRTRQRDHKMSVAAALARLQDQARAIAGDQKALLDEIAALTQGKAKGLLDAQAAERSSLEQQARARQRAQAALDSLAALAREQEQQIEALNEMRRRLSKASPRARKAAEGPDLEESMRKAAQALGHRDTAESARQADRAAEQAEAVAEALESARTTMGGKNPKAPDWLLRQADKADQARENQQELRRTAERLAARRRSLIRDELTRLRVVQAALAEDAGQLATEVSRSIPQPDRLQTRAAQSAADAAGELRKTEQGAFDRAARDASTAHQQLAELGERLGRPEAAPDPEPATTQSTQPLEDTPQRRRELSGRASDLAEKQSRLAKQIAALAREEPAEVLAERQREVAQAAVSVAGDTDLVREHMADLGMGEEDAKLASEASKSAAQARHSAAQAAGRMPEDLTAAQEPQARAVEAMDETAKRLTELGKRLAARPTVTPEPVEVANPQDLADAYEAAQAAEASEPAGAALAAELLAGVSQSAIEMARSMGADIGLLSLGELPPWMSPEDGKGVGLLWISRSLAEIHELGISSDQWARLPGELRSEILQAAETEGPEEYRAYIREYFRELARRASAPPADPSAEDKP